MADAISAHGTLLKIGDGGGPETFTTIAEITDIQGPEFEGIVKEVTNHDSAGWVEKLSVLTRVSELTFEINFRPDEATHGYASGLLGDLVARTKRNFQIVWPDASTTTWSFAAYVTKFAPAAPADDALMASVTLDLAEPPTLA